VEDVLEISEILFCFGFLNFSVTFFGEEVERLRFIDSVDADGDRIVKDIVISEVVNE
jgi:hypothetical protein